MLCKECGQFHNTDNKYFCPDCEEKHQRRNEFREIMNKLDKINQSESRERNFLNGFSYAEQERFSLIMKKFIKANHFPDKDKDFVNSNAKKELDYIRKTIFF